jgi:putative ABC transport system permease protein
MKQLDLALRSLPEIESVSGMTMPPYSTSTWIWGGMYNGRNVQTHMNLATDDLADVLSIHLTAGRWFSKDDDGSTFAPAIINEKLAKDLYGSDDPVGKELPYGGEHQKSRVIGVVEDFRKAGEFSQNVNYMITRISYSDTTMRNSWDFLIRVKPGINASFEEKLVRTLESVARGWTFEVASLDHERDTYIRKNLAPLLAGAVVAGFLLLMVALGLVGVLWQNVSQRTREIGLRRALGGTAGDVSRQIHLEQFLITSIGVAAGSVLVMQFPILNLIEFVKPAAYVEALAVSLVLMYTLTYLCSLFPGWLAMDIEPAEALHYE